MNDYDFWKREWGHQARAKNAFEAAAGSNFAKNPFEFLHNVNAVHAGLKLKNTDSLLDVGCGTGLYTVALATSVKKIVGVEYIPLLVTRAKKACDAYPAITIKKGDLLRVPSNPHSFDKVLVGSVLQYLGDTQVVAKALKELHRVTRKGGLVLMTLIPDMRKKEEYLQGIQSLPLPKARKRSIYNKNNRGLWLNRVELKALAEEAGFRATILPVPKEVWQSWYMFNLLLKKK